MLQVQEWVLATPSLYMGRCLTVGGRGSDREIARAGKAGHLGRRRSKLTLANVPTHFPHFPRRYLGPDLGSTTAQRRSDLTLANLPAVSARHFPLCMHTLMQSLRRDHHLRHNGRQQLSLFLKVWEVWGR